MKRYLSILLWLGIAHLLLSVVLASIALVVPNPPFELVVNLPTNLAWIAFYFLLGLILLVRNLKKKSL